MTLGGESLRKALDTLVVEQCVMKWVKEAPKSSHIGVLSAATAARVLEELRPMLIGAGSVETVARAIEISVDKHAGAFHVNLPERTAIDIELLRLATNTENQLRSALGTASRQYTGEQLDYLENIKISVLPHDENTLRIISDTHELHRVSNETMELLERDSSRRAMDEFAAGGFLDRLVPTKREEEEYSKVFKRKYESPLLFYKRLLGLAKKRRGKTREMGDVLVLGTEDERNLCILRIPPKDPQRLENFGATNRHFFTKSQILRGGNPNWIIDNYDKLMEVAMIARQDRGAANELLLQGWLETEKLGRKVEGVFMEHFESIQRTLPTPDLRPTTQIINKSSGEYFGKLGASTYAYKSDDYVFRELKSTTVVGGRVTWNRRLAPIGQFLHSLRTYVAGPRGEIELRREFPGDFPLGDRDS